MTTKTKLPFPISVVHCSTMIFSWCWANLRRCQSDEGLDHVNDWDTDWKKLIKNSEFKYLHNPSLNNDCHTTENVIVVCKNTLLKDSMWAAGITFDVDTFLPSGKFWFSEVYLPTFSYRNSHEVLMLCKQQTHCHCPSSLLLRRQSPSSLNIIQRRS